MFRNPPKAIALLAISLLLVVTISGCTGGGPTISTGPGVVILNWEPDFTSVESGEQLNLRIRIQNQGTETAEDVIAILSGINQNEWDVSNMEIDFGNLLPPNTQYGTEGEMAEDFFSLEAPELPEGITQQYTPRIRIIYNYLTSATKPITLVNENELRRMLDEGEMLPSGPTQYSSGPLSVTVNTGSHIRALERDRKAFPITIRIQNVGGGVVSSMGSVEDDYRVKLKIELPPGLGLETCREFDGSGDYITLWKGQSKDMTCELEIEDTPTISEEKTIILTLEYDYYVDATTSVTVKGLGQ